MITSFLETDECRVRWADPRRRPVEDLLAVLSDVERRRATGFHREQDRRRFVTACWLLRSCVGAELGLPPERVAVERTCSECGRPHGKPRILGGPAALEVSVSHAGDRVAVALTTAGPVGIDVEEVLADAAAAPEIALTPAESTVLRGLAPRERDSGFIQMWVRKEAALKATGHGLRVPPDQVEVSGPAAAPALLRWPLPIDPGSVAMHRLDPGDGYAAVVAVLSAGRPVRVSGAVFSPGLDSPFRSPALAAA